MERLTSSPEDLLRAAELLRRAELVIFPTETFYALGALAFSERALEKVFALKGRDASQPVALIAGSAEQAFSLWPLIPERARALAERYWPGPLTLVLPGRDDLPKALSSPYGVGARVSGHKTARALALLAQSPLVATSANPSGAAPFQRAEEVRAALPGASAIVEDDEGVLGGKPSTLVTFVGDEVKLLRAGAIEIQGATL